MSMPTVTRETSFGDAFYAVISNTVPCMPETPVAPPAQTSIVHDPFCTRSLMMHAMVDTGCMIERPI
jgi:hypothetical protein